VLGKLTGRWVSNGILRQEASKLVWPAMRPNDLWGIEHAIGAIAVDAPKLNQSRVATLEISRNSSHAIR